jgi:hypothetical protein
LWGTDSWLRSEWFPKIVNDLVGRNDVMFRPRPGDRDRDSLYTRMVKKFIPEASESPLGEYWRRMYAEDPPDPENLLEYEDKIPFMKMYVYSSHFLASVMMLVYEVIKPKP